VPKSLIFSSDYECAFVAGEKSGPWWYFADDGAFARRPAGREKARDEGDSGARSPTRH
jgi:hypothetical protein